MTRQEARDLLKNTKVCVEGKSKEVQEKLFSLGINWGEYPETPKYCKFPYLYIIDASYGIYITYGLGEDIFESLRKYKELSESYIINLSIDDYRPFKDETECIEEMERHTKFGCLKNINGGYGFITEIKSNSILIGTKAYTYYSAFDMFEFLDGTSFGIKK